MRVESAQAAEEYLPSDVQLCLEADHAGVSELISDRRRRKRLERDRGRGRLQQWIQRQGVGRHLFAASMSAFPLLTDTSCTCAARACAAVAATALSILVQ